MMLILNSHLAWKPLFLLTRSSLRSTTLSIASDKEGLEKKAAYFILYFHSPSFRFSGEKGEPAQRSRDESTAIYNNCPIISSVDKPSASA
jgi:hypothetical protein